MSHSHKPPEQITHRYSKPSRPPKHEILAAMLEPRAEGYMPVPVKMITTKVMEGVENPETVARQFLLWTEPQQFEFLSDLRDAGASLRHQLFSAIMQGKNGQSFSSRVKHQLDAMDFKSKAEGLAMEYAEYTGSSKAVITVIRTQYPDPLLLGLLADAFQIVHDISGTNTQKILHRVIRNLRGENGAHVDQ